jgi:type II secretory pathway component PulL
MSLKKDTVLLTEKINTIYRSTFPEDKRIVDASRQFMGNLKVLREKKNILGGVPVTDILLNIALVDNKNITLDEVHAGTQNILMKGTALSFEDVDMFKKALLSSFKDIKVADSTSAPDNKISFSITMREKAL